MPTIQEQQFSHSLEHHSHSCKCSFRLPTSEPSTAYGDVALYATASTALSPSLCSSFLHECPAWLLPVTPLLLPNLIRTPLKHRREVVARSIQSHCTPTNLQVNDQARYSLFFSHPIGGRVKPHKYRHPLLQTISSDAVTPGPSSTSPHALANISPLPLPGSHCATAFYQQRLCLHHVSSSSSLLFTTSTIQSCIFTLHCLITTHLPINLPIHQQTAQIQQRYHLQTCTPNSSPQPWLWPDLPLLGSCRTFTPLPR